MFSIVRQDLHRACLANQGRETGAAAHLREVFNPGTQAILAHRLGRWARDLRVPVLRDVLIAVHFLVEYLFAWRVGILIPAAARIGPGFVIHTWGGGLVLPACPIGRNLTIVGGGVQFDYATASIGEHCEIGPGVKCVGKIRIGDRVKIAPNAVVQVDVPDDAIVFGNPARIIRRRAWKLAPTGSAQERAIAAARGGTAGPAAASDASPSGGTAVPTPASPVSDIPPLT